MKNSNALSIGALCLAVSAALAFSPFEVELTVSGYSKTETLENFPVLVRIAERDDNAGTGISGFHYADLANPSTGADLWFSSDPVGRNVIPHDIDEWHADGESLVWVGVPALSAGTAFYMHYGDAAPQPYAPSNVWLNASYIGVWHMNEASGNVADATGLGHTAVPKGTRASTDSVAVADGVVGKARQNSASGTRGSGSNNCFLQVANTPVLAALKDFATASQWVKLSSAFSSHQYTRAYGHKKSNGTAGGFECELGTGSVLLRGHTQGGTVTLSLSPSALGNWTYFAAVHDGIVMRGYGNGGATTAQTFVSTPVGAVTYGYGIGSNPSGGEIALGGWMDEYRLRAAASSAAWVSAEYDTVKVANFVTASAVQSPAGAVFVYGEPVAYGSPSPGYGMSSGYAANDPVTLTAPASVLLNAAGTERAVCTGWTLYNAATDAVVAESDASNATSCTFAFAVPVRIVWHWRREVFVEVLATSGGTVSPSFWTVAGTQVTVTQQADAGCSFHCWGGDLSTTDCDYKDASLTFTATTPMTLTAQFVGGATTAKTYSGANNGEWDVASNWTPAGVPTYSDDVTIPNGRRVAAGRQIFAASVTLAGSGAISQGGATTAYNQEVQYTTAPTYSKRSDYGRKAADFTSMAPFIVDVAGDVSMSGSSQWIVGGHNSPAYKDITIGGHLTMAGTSMFAIYAGKGDMAAEPEKGGARFGVAGKATIGAGTVIDAFCNVNISETAGTGDFATGAFVLLSLGETEVASGGTIRSRIGVTDFSTLALRSLGCPATSGHSLAGGGHGGIGGASGSTAGGAAYDWLRAPILPGAAGSLNRTFGGGVVRLDTDALSLAGTISANAFYSGNQHERGAPAGGSVWITCDSLDIASGALITANGANGVAYSNYNIGGGAGGRIAIALGLTAEQKTALARTGECEDISSLTLLSDLYPDNVSVSGGSGILSGTAAEDGTAVRYAWVDSSKAAVAVATTPAGLSDAAFSPAVGASVEVVKGGTFTATAPAVLDLFSGCRRLATGWVATREDESVFASGDGQTATIANVTENLTLNWKYETLQYYADVAAYGDGAVSGASSGWIAAGTPLALSASASSGASFKGWICGRFLGADASSSALSIPVDRPLKIAAVFTGSSSLAAKTYTGASGGSWDEDANWTPAGVPTTADAVTIPDNMVVAVGESAAAGSIALGTNATLSVFGRTTAFYSTFTVNSLSQASIGRSAADYDATNIWPSLEVAGDFTAGEGATVAIGGLGQRGQSVVFAGGNLSLGANVRMSVYAGPTVTGLITYGDGTGSVTVRGALSLASGSFLDLVGYRPNLSYYITLSRIPVLCGSLDVAAGAAIKSNFPYGYAPGGAINAGVGGNSGRVSGGGHGGAGGSGTMEGTTYAGGSAWDSPYAPFYPGSMGRKATDYGTTGGGAIHITAGNVRLAGEINADAVYGCPYECGGAAGGSIWIVCGSFRAESTARLSARGMNGGVYSSYQCGGGGGGRISVCKGLSGAQIATLQAGGTPSGSIGVTDATRPGATFEWLGDVSAGVGGKGGADGENGTFFILSPARTLLLLQ